MSHGDLIAKLAPGFEVIATSANCPFAAVRNARAHDSGASSSIPRSCTPSSARACSRTSCCAIAGLHGTWTMDEFIARQIHALRERIGDRQVVCGVSGRRRLDGRRGAAAPRDRRPAALLLRRQRPAARGRARGGRTLSFHDVLKIPLVTLDETERFLRNLRGIEDPEKKRVVIGHTFVGRVRARRERDSRRALPGAGDALPGRDRVGLGARAVGHDQDPPQRRRSARAHEARGGRAAARAVQGRGARSRRAPRRAARALAPPPVPGPGPGDPRARRGHARAARAAARRRPHRHRRDPRRRARTTSSGRRSPCSCRSAPSA